MKSDEFNDYVMEQAANVEGIELNQEAIDSIKLSSMITDANRYGTSTASSESSVSSEAEDTSSVSSSTSSESSTSEESSAVSSQAE